MGKKTEVVGDELKKARKFFQEFREFAVKGNMIDMAVGIIIGGAFSALINSIVTNLITPLIGVLIGVDFKAWEIELPRPYGNAPPSTLGIGVFLNSVISFVILAFTVFLFVRMINRFRNRAEPPPPKPSPEQLLLTEIRDILKESGIER